MADTKISALTPGGPAQSSDVLPIARAGANFSLTAQNIADLAGGGGGPAVGSNVVDLGNQQPIAVGPLGTGNSMCMKISGRALLSLPSIWTVSIRRAATSHFTAIVILRTAIDDLTVLDSTPVLFGGSATPTMADGINTSDNISLQLDASHDYYVVGHNDSGDTSFWGLKPAVALNSNTLGTVGGYIPGDQTGLTSIPASFPSGTGFGCPWQLVSVGGPA
jgi:hypothetical protein